MFTVLLKILVMNKDYRDAHVDSALTDLKPNLVEKDSQQEQKDKPTSVLKYVCYSSIIYLHAHDVRRNIEKQLPQRSLLYDMNQKLLLPGIPIHISTLSLG